MRVTPMMMEQQMMTQTQNAANVLDTAQEEEATGLPFQNPAQNPDSAVTTINLEAQIQQVSTYQTNQTNAQNQLNASADALNTMISALNQAQSLAVEASNATLTPTNEGDIGRQVTALQNTLMSAMNAQYNGVSLFAANPANLTGLVASGASIVNLPTTPTLAYTNLVSVGPAAAVAININGFEMGGATSAFQTTLTAMNDLSTALSTGAPMTSVAFANLQSVLSALQNAETGLTNEQGIVGGRLDEINTQKAQAGTWSTTLQTTLGTVDEVNLPNVTTQFATASQIMQAALQSASQVLNLNIWDMIRA